MKLVKLAALATLVMGSQAFAYTSTGAAEVSATVEAKVEFVNPLAITGTNIDYGSFLINKVATGNIIELNPATSALNAPTDSDIFDDDHQLGSIEVSGWAEYQGNGDANDFSGNGYVAGVYVSANTVTGDMNSGGALTKTLECHDTINNVAVASCAGSYDLTYLSTNATIEWNLGGEIEITDKTLLNAAVYTQDFIFTADYE